MLSKGSDFSDKYSNDKGQEERYETWQITILHKTAGRTEELALLRGGTESNL